MATVPTREQQKAANTGLANQPFERMFFKDNAPFQIVKPKNGSGDTIIRVYPAFAPDGCILPAVTGHVTYGTDQVADVSNFDMIYTTMAQGFQGQARFTGCVVPSDWPTSRYSRPELESPISGLYVKLKHKQKPEQGGLSPEVAAKFAHAAARGPVGPNNKFGSSPALSSPEETYLVSCVVLKLNGENLPQPIYNAMLILRGTAARVYAAAVARAWDRAMARKAANPAETFQDPFAPETGVCFTFGTMPANALEGRQKDSMSCVAGMSGYTGVGLANIASLEAAATAVPIPLDKAREFYRNPQDWIKLNTWAELMRNAIACYGPQLVEAGQPTQYAEYMALLGMSPAAAPNIPSAPAVAPQATQTHQPAATTLVPFPPVAPTPAPHTAMQQPGALGAGLFGATTPAAPAAAAAVTAPPALTFAPAAAPAAAAAAGAIDPAGLEALMSSFSELESQK